jgi:hypothetical protein
LASHGDSDDSDAEPDPIESCKRIWKYVSDPKNSVAITAIATLVICVTGIFYTIFAKFQWSANQESAEAAKSAATTAARQLELAERPWLMTKAEIAGPITFAGGEMRADFLFRTKNVGNSPAMRVESGEEIFFGSFPRVSPPAEMTLLRKRQFSESS